MIVSTNLNGMRDLLPAPVRSMLKDNPTNWVKDIRKGTTAGAERAKVCSNILLTLLDSTEWKHNPPTFNLAGKLYKEVKRSSETREACKAEIKTIKTAFRQFKSCEMSKEIKKFEKNIKGHPNGTEMRSKIKKLKRKGVKSESKRIKKAKSQVGRVHYFSQDERIKHLALFRNDGTMKLPKAVKSCHDLIYVVDKYGQFFVGEEKKIHDKKLKHSSFLKGRPVAGAGSLSLCPVTHNIRKINDSSGHYRPGKSEMKNTLIALARSGVDLAKLHVKCDGKESTANSWDLA